MMREMVFGSILFLQLKCILFFDIFYNSGGGLYLENSKKNG